jgi:glutamate---cysteine ligase / carboxylate-amine ligase
VSQDRSLEAGAQDAVAPDDFQFTFGIEEEFFIGHRRSRNVAVQVPARLLKRAQRELSDVVTHELLQCQVELVSPILDTIDGARTHVMGSRRELARLAAVDDLSLIAAGTHPLAVWAEQEITDDPRYEEVRNAFQIVGRRNLFCGLHIHVAVPPGIDRVRLMNRAMRWLPLFLAFSTSSPFWGRSWTGLLSYRQAAYDEWPRSGIPDFFESEAQYGEFAQRLVRGGAMKDASFLWWAIRPSTHYPTLELRICDACTNPEDTVALAALYRSLIAFLVRNPTHLAEWTPLTRRIVDENRWRAKRYGTRAQFIDDVTGDVTSVAEWYRQLRGLVHEDADRLGCTLALQRLDTVLSAGTSAHRQMEIYIAARKAGGSRMEALKRVVDWLAEQTAPAVATAKGSSEM